MSAAADLCAALQAELEPVGISVDFGFGKPLSQYPVTPAVWLAHDDQSDLYSAPCGTRERAKARRLWDRVAGLTVRIEGSSPLAGARYGDHCAHVLEMVDAVIRCLSRWSQARDANYSIGRAGFEAPETESVCGMVYTFALSIPEHVTDKAPPTVRVEHWETTWALAAPTT